MRSRTRLTEEREQPVRIAVFVDVEAPDELVEAVREALRPQTSGARVHVEACAPGETLIIDPTADAVIALAGPGTTLARFARRRRARSSFRPSSWRSMKVPTWSPDGSPIPCSTPSPTSEPDATVHGLGRWLVDRLNGKRLALATNFAFMRRAVAEEAIKATSFQNGVVGLVMVIPGADLPIMTANQAKMVLQIAAAYGEPLGAERIKELAVVRRRRVRPARHRPAVARSSSPASAGPSRPASATPAPWRWATRPSSTSRPVARWAPWRSR